MKKDPYDMLVDSLKDWLFGLPASEHLKPLLAQRITPHEAALLAKIPHLPHTLQQLQTRLDIDPDNLKERLNDWSKKGLVMLSANENETRYALTDSLMWFYRMPGYEGKNDNFNRALAPLLNQYASDAYSQTIKKLPSVGLRAVPINQTIPDHRQIKPYEDILQIIDQTKRISVTSCSCRHRHNLDPHQPNCQHPTETCLHFDHLTDYLLAHGIGRPISKQEAIDILNMAANQGLIHSASNIKQGIDTVCNCCPCCCLFIKSQSNIPTYSHKPSSYQISHQPDKCKNCQLCVKRCPTKAITLDIRAEKPKINLDRCLGCGVCAHKCPTQALKLVPRIKKYDIPQDKKELVQKILAEQGLNAKEVFQRNM